MLAVVVEVLGHGGGEAVLLERRGAVSGRILVQLFGSQAPHRLVRQGARSVDMGGCEAEVAPNRSRPDRSYTLSAIRYQGPSGARRLGTAVSNCSLRQVSETFIPSLLRHLPESGDRAGCRSKHILGGGR